MDAQLIHSLGEVIGPAIAILVTGAIPISIVFMNRYFKLKTREMELDAELHSRELEARLNAVEARQGATESAITALANGLSIGRSSMLEPPPAEPSRLPHEADAGDDAATTLPSHRRVQNR
jgi:hypothetical protein